MSAVPTAAPVLSPSSARPRRWRQSSPSCRRRTSSSTSTPPWPATAGLPRSCPAPPSTTPSRPTRNRCCWTGWRRPAAVSTWPAPRRWPAPWRRERTLPTSCTPTRSNGVPTWPLPPSRASACSSSTRSRRPGRWQTRPPGPRCSAACPPQGPAPTGRSRASTAARPARRWRSSGPLPTWVSSPAGLSFHVGSQQRDPEAWNAPIEAAARVFRTLRRQGVDLRLLDLGGGFPAHLEGGCPPLAAYGAAIERHLSRHFGDRRPETLVEPGRAVVGDAGTLVSTVVAVVRRGRTRWVFLDAGVFTGLVETLDEAIRYPLRTNVDGGPDRSLRAGGTDL